MVLRQLMLIHIHHRYSERYHQYFPIANPAAMEFQNLHTSAAKEPHLLAAILTVASRDEKVCASMLKHAIIPC